MITTLKRLSIRNKMKLIAIFPNIYYYFIIKRFI
jgi:hypothetical protein